MGIEVSNIDAGARRSLRIPAELEGVVIADVSVRGDAYEKGLRPGMVIMEVNRTPVSNIGDYRDVLAGVDEGGLVSFYIWTRTQGGETRNFVTFRVRGD